VGSWLVPLLNSDSRFVQERAVEYLLMISSISDHTLKNQQGTNNNARNGSLQRLPSSANVGVTDRKKYEVYSAVEKQEGLAFAMLKLTSTMFEQAAATNVIQWVLDKKLFRTFSLFIIACDMIFLILIITMFRWSSSIFFSEWVYALYTIGYAEEYPDYPKYINILCGIQLSKAKPNDHMYDDHHVRN
jgi:hypothetical protein